VLTLGAVSRLLLAGEVTGIPAGINVTLQVVGRLLGQEQARRTARYMEYDWRPVVS
jgi:hypothetical protein